MNQICKVCGEPAAGFHFGAFTCEGCKSFFGRSYNNLSSISECKNNGKCIIDKKNRTTCKACRLRKCYTVGMSKGGSRYGRRSNWFKIHCLLQEQQQQAVDAAGKAGSGAPPSNGFGDMATAAAVAAQQHLQQQRSSHMAQHMGGLLGYPGYLPEMSPFLSAAAAAASRHPADNGASALPFFSMMNGLPAPQSAYQLPPHLLFPSYHPGAAAAAAADAAYRSEMFQHRQSIDSLSESQRFSPAARSTHSTVPSEERIPSARQSPVLCVSGDEDQPECHSNLSHHSSAASSPISAASSLSHHIHSPVALRATPKASPMQPENTYNAPLMSVTPPKSQASSPEPHTAAASAEHHATANTDSHAAFAAKMQSLSPVSVCSISVESLPVAPNSRLAADDQDCPMDLSMKTSRSSVHSFDTSAGESDVSEEELRQAAAAAATRRKFYQLSEQESDASSDTTAEVVKRQKLVTEAQSYNGFSSNPTSLRGIFVCV